MKNDAGITMLMMVITVVMITLIAAFSIYNAQETITETKITRAYNEMKEVRDAVKRYVLLSVDKRELEAFKFSNPEDNRVLNIYYTDFEGREFYFLDFKNQKSYLEDILELNHIENNYMVDMTEDMNIHIYLMNGLKIGNEVYYTDSEMIENYGGLFLKGE